MLDFLFKKKSNLACPYCLADTRGSTNSCGNCKKPLPTQYLANYKRLSPFFVQMIGWPNVGKTIYLQVLTLMLMRMTRAWPDYTYAAGTTRTQALIQEMNNFLLGKGLLPEPTVPEDGKQPYVMFLEGMERWGSRMLVTRDCTGESFDTMEIHEDSARYILYAPTVLMLISLWDLENKGEGKSMDMLLNTYIETMIAGGVDLYKDKRSVVVVLTKCDKDTIMERLPQNLVNYLREDPLWSTITSKEAPNQLNGLMMAEYMEKMERVSNSIENWISRDSTGLNLVRLAQRNNITLKFSLVSSIGFDPEKTGNSSIEARAVTREQLSPKRVLDPYLWALELQSR